MVDSQNGLYFDPTDGTVLQSLAALDTATVVVAGHYNTVPSVREADSAPTIPQALHLLLLDINSTLEGTH